MRPPVPRFVSREGRVLPGVRRVVPIPNPNPATDWTVPVQGGRQWRIQGGSATLTTDATAGQRFVGLDVTLDGVRLHHLVDSVGVAPSTAAPVSIVAPAMAAATGDRTFAMAISAPDFWMPAGAILSSLTSAFGAADQWSNINLWVEELWVTDDQLREDAADAERHLQHFLSDAGYRRTGG